MNKIILGFFLLCVPLRLLLIYVALTSNKKYLAGITLVITIYWIITSTINFRNVWWNPYRLFHAINYFSYSLLTFLNYNLSYIFLIIDLLYGIFVFVLQYFDEINEWVNDNILNHLHSYKIRIVKS